MDLVAVDPPISMVNRLITSFSKVSTCRPRKDEDLVTFADRFRGLASEHLMHTGFESSTHIGKHLVFTLINHAMRPEKNLHNAVLQLLTQAQSCNSLGSVADCWLGLFSVLENIREFQDELVKVLSPIQIQEAQEDMVKEFEEFCKEVASIKNEMAVQTVRISV